MRHEAPGAVQEYAEEAPAIPVLPARCTARAKAFYERLGFRASRSSAPDYIVLRAGEVEVHVFHWPSLEPENSQALQHISVRDADALHQAWSRVQLPAHGLPRMSALSETPWGARQFALVDPDGNCLSFGHCELRDS